MTTDQHIQRLYQSEVFHIEDYRCGGHDTPRGDEEATLHYEIVFPRSGMFVRRDAAGNSLADPNHILFFQPNQPFQITHPVQCCDTSTIVAIAPEVIHDLLSCLDPYFHPEKPFPRAAVQTDVSLRLLQTTFLNRAFAADTAQETLAHDEQLLALLSRILQSAFEVRALLPLYKSGWRYEQHVALVDSVKQVVNTHYREKLTLGGIARHVNHSMFSLARLFREHTGLAIHQYVIRIRLLNALEELREHPKASISQIALRTGFCTPSHFSTVFIETFGVTPSDFRQLDPL